MSALSDDIAGLAAAARELIEAGIPVIVAQHHVPPEAVRDAVIRALAPPRHGVALNPAMDNRIALWRVRMQLWPADAREPAADTEPEAPPEGVTAESALLRGMTGDGGVVAWVRELVFAFHTGVDASQIGGLDDLTMAQRIRGLRPTLSRRGGNATWRIPYTVNGASWVARCYVQREDRR